MFYPEIRCVCQLVCNGIVGLDDGPQPIGVIMLQMEIGLAVVISSVSSVVRTVSGTVVKIDSVVGGTVPISVTVSRVVKDFPKK